MSGYQVLDKSGKVIYSSGRGSVCDESCRRCVFHATATGGMIVCDYLLVMGRRRGCEAGKNCIRRINGKKAPSLDSRLYRLPPNPERETGIPAAALRAPSSGDGMADAAGTGDAGSPSRCATAPSRRGTEDGEKTEEKIDERKRRKSENHKRWAEETPEERERRLAKERERYARNKDKMHAKQKAQREKRTPEQRQRKTEYMRQWREANRERMNAYQRQRRSQETPEQRQRRREAAKQWAIENREKVNAAQQAYRSRKKAEKEEASDG